MNKNQEFRPKYIKTMRQKEDFLKNMKDILAAYCHVIQIDLSPSQSNTSSSHLYLEGRGGVSENALNVAGDKLKKYTLVQKETGPDGNHHKLGQMVRKKANHLYDAAQALTNVNQDYMHDLKRTSRFITDMKGFEPNIIARAIDTIIFSADHKKLTQ